MAKKKGPAAPVRKAAKLEPEPPDATGEDVVPCSAATEFTEGKITWLWQDLISFGGWTFLVGDPGCGKSTICCDIAARFTRGRAMPDGSKPGKGSVLFLIAEDDIGNVLVPRLRAARADLSRCFFFGRSPGRQVVETPRFPGACESLGKAIQEHRARLVIVDPWVSFLAPGLSSSYEQDVRTALEPVGYVAQQTGAALIGLRHPNKQVGVKKLYRAAGSLGVNAVARTVLWAGEEGSKPGQYVLSLTKTNLQRIPAPVGYCLDSAENAAVVRWTGPTKEEQEDPVTAAEAAGKRVVLEDAKRLITLALAGGSKPAKVLLKEAEDNGIGRRTLVEAKAQLGVKSRRKSDGGGISFWEWTLPKGKGG
jgi:RecA-family ATPase